MDPSQSKYLNKTIGTQEQAKAAMFEGMRNANAPDRQPSGRLDLSLHRFGNALSNLHGIIESLEQLADRITGSVPENGEKNSTAVDPDSVAGRLEMHASLLEGLIERLGHATTRLHQL